MSQLNDIHADIGHLQAQMENVNGNLERIATIVTTVALHDERINNIRNQVDNHAQFIEGSKIRKWTIAGMIIAGSMVCSAAGAAFANHLLTVHIP